MGKLLGQFSRLSLTYEAAVLAMLVDYCALEGEPETVRGKCALHPAHPHPYFKVTPGISYAARVNIILASCAAEDNIADGRGLRIKGRAAKAAWRKGLMRARTAYPELYEYIRGKLDRLSELEKARTQDIDDFTAPFAEMLGRVFTVDGMIASVYIDALYGLGSSLGRWIMLVDAADDRIRDRKRGNFNIYNERLGDSNESEADALVRTHCIMEAEKCWQTLKQLHEGRPDPDTEGFMDNLFGEGLAFIDRGVSERGREDNAHGSV